MLNIIVKLIVKQYKNCKKLIYLSFKPSEALVYIAYKDHWIVSIWKWQVQPILRRRTQQYYLPYVWVKAAPRIAAM